MANPKISKMVTRRQKQCELVEWFLQVHRQEVAESLDLFLRQIGVPGWSEDDELPPDVETFLDRLGGRLRGALDVLLEAEQSHLDEVANDTEPRQRRDRAVDDLRDDLFHLRDLFRGAYSKSTAEEIGFEKRIAPDPCRSRGRARGSRAGCAMPRDGARGSSGARPRKSGWIRRSGRRRSRRRPGTPSWPVSKPTRTARMTTNGAL